MYVAKYDRMQNVDAITRKWFVEGVRKSLVNDDDDHLLLIVGDTGSGKSNLALWLMELYMGVEASVDYVAFNESELGVCMKRVSDKMGLRCLLYDEANVSKRNSMTKLNKDIIDLYFSNRGLNCLHLFCNPSVDSFDKMLLNERVKAVIFIFDKAKDRPRVFFFIPKAKLIQIYQKYKNLNLNTIKKVCGAYSLYRGWFREYKGVLKEPYLIKKNKRIEDKVAVFYQRYSGKDWLSPSKIGRTLGLSKDTVLKYIDLAEKEGLFKQGSDFMRNALGHVTLNPSLVEQLEQFIVEFKNRGDESAA